MAWTSPITFVAGQAPTSAQLNAMLYDNMMETEAAKADGFSHIFVSSGRNNIVQRQVQIGYGDPSGTLSSSSYVTHSTMPSVTLDTGAAALVIWSALISASGSATYTDYVAVSVKVTGATSINATDSYAIITHKSPAGVTTIDGFMMAHYFNNLNPGTNTFQMQGRVTTGNATIDDCTIVGMPF